MGVFSGRVTKSPRKLTEAALPTRRPAQFICCCWYFLRVNGHFRRKNKLCYRANLARRPDFWAATGPPLARGHRYREHSNGSPDLMCGRRFCSAYSATSAEEPRNGAAIDVAPRAISSPTLLPAAREVGAGGEITKAIPPRLQRRPVISAPLVFVTPGFQMPPGT